MFWFTRKTITAASGVIVMAAAAGVVALSAGAANANATTPYSYTNQCGSGYAVIDRGDTAHGTVFLTYNSSTKKNCVVTVFGNSDGVRHFLRAWIAVSGSSKVYEDAGSYKYYAGPVYVYAPHACISWGGVTLFQETYESHRDLTPPLDDVFSQSKSHCG